MFLKRLQLGLTHVAVAITLVPINSTLNRVMIKELAVSATLVAILASLPYLFAAMRLAVPRALLGVMIAEWLATGTGLGNLLNQSRGYLDYGMIWTVAAVSVLLSVVFYQIVVLSERWLLGRLGMRTSE